MKNGLYLPSGFTLQADIIVQAGGVAGTVAEFLPTDGEKWLISGLYASHDDPATPTLQYQLTDRADSYWYPVSGALGVNERWYLFPQHTSPEPLVLSYDFYLRINASAMAAGKKITVVALCYQLKGLNY